jgi:hypothetical protein
MFHIPKKLLALLAPLALVVGLAAPSMALAVKASESLPSTESKNWTGVKTECEGVETPAKGCEFVATSTASVLENGEAKVTTCGVVLKGKIFKDGSSEVTAAEITSGNAICKAIEFKGLPWKDQICEYTGSTPHSYYDRISINFFKAENQEIKGPIYVHLLNASKLDESPLTVKFASARKFANALKPAEIGKGPWGILADGELSSTMYEFGAKPVIKVISTETSCPWNFEVKEEEGKIVKEGLNELP